MTTQFLEVQNNAASVTAGAINNSSDPVTFSAATGEGGRFPSAYPYHLTIDDEILAVTSRTGDSMTAARAQQGTTIASHSTGASVELRITSKLISDLNSAVNTLETGTALLAGRPGGQTILGGTATGDGIKLTPTSGATPTGDIEFDLTLSTSTAQIANTLLPTSLTWAQVAGAVGSGQTVTIDAAGGVRGQQFLGTYNVTNNPNASSFVGWTFAPTIALSSPNTTNLNIISAFRATPVFNLDTGSLAYGATGLTPLSGVGFTPTFNAPASGTSTATVGSTAAVASSMVLATGWTISARRGLLHQAVVGSTGTITDDIAVDVDDLNTFTGTKTNPFMSLRSIGTAVQMRHAGPGVFGANAAPANSSVGLEVQSTTMAFLASRMTTTQRDAMTPLNGMVIYNTTTTTIQGYQGGAWTNL